MLGYENSFQDPIPPCRCKFHITWTFTSLPHLLPSFRTFVSGHSEDGLGHHHHHHLSLGGLGGHLDHRHQSLAELLRTTTLEEFLHAVEKVEAEDEQLIGEILIVRV